MEYQIMDSWDWSDAGPGLVIICVIVFVGGYFVGLLSKADESIEDYKRKAHEESIDDKLHDYSDTKEVNTNVK